ncbi:pentatricopeptide repeat-containing protein at3g02650 mitochondrial [Phtheirospermum japonicum]|uniref:Pentatricopeptide repeat-containing protein at3g02650 mitochondrial n=1 Tax=Phtheirospermum japonicum TaxID=374723 RepID=A0A830C164_9LAMI|nr:pentatricopeptide repeat-containing protein at3g02650 mitochondrial [Phtheirospermum japonicum]
MWRPLARRASLYRRTPAPRLRPTILHPQVPRHQSSTPPLPSIQSASHFSLFSRTSHFNQNPRFFSSSSAENHEDPPTEQLISEGNETASGFDFNAPNLFDESPNPESENEDSIFDGAVGDFDGSVALDGNLDVEDEGLGQVKTNDAEKVENLLSMLQSSGTISGSLESNLEEMDLVLDDQFILKVLETPCIRGENLIGFFKWVLKKSEFKSGKVMLDALVSAVCIENRKREAYNLWDLVNEINEKERGVVSTKSLNALIAEFSRLGKGKAAFDVFNKFDEFGCELNDDTYYLTIEALCKRSFKDWASSVCEKMLSADKLPDSEKVGKIITYLCKGGLTKDAHLVYIYAKDKKINPPKSSINFLISSLSRIETADKKTEKEINKELDRETISLALEMLSDYTAENRKHAIKPFSSVIKKLCWIQDVDGAKKLLLEMIEHGPPPGNAVFNCVINGLTKNGNTEEAVSVMRLMEKRGLKPDVYTYSVIMSGYARNGEMERACAIFEEAKKNHSKLSPVTFHTLIRGFCKLEQYDKAVSLLGEMKAYGVNASHDEYNKLIKSLCFKALDWETAEKLEEEMRANGVILNGRTKALISAIKELKEGESDEISTPV